MTKPEDTTQDAGGSPLERPVRPWGVCIDLDAQPIGFDRRIGDILRWHKPQLGPLYDQAALDAAIAIERAAEREWCIEAVEGNFAGSAYGLPPRIAALIVERIRGA